MKRLLTWLILGWAAKRFVKMLNSGELDKMSYASLQKYGIADIVRSSETGERAFLFDGTHPVHYTKGKK